MKRSGSRLVGVIIGCAMAAITLGGGLIILVRGADATAFRCERASGECPLIIGNRLDTTTLRYPLAEMGRATVKAREDRYGISSWVEIERTNNRILILGGSTRDEAEKRAVADGYNRFFQNQQAPTYTYRQVAPSVAIFGLAWATFGLGFATVSYWQFRKWREGE